MLDVFIVSKTINSIAVGQLQLLLSRRKFMDSHHQKHLSWREQRAKSVSSFSVLCLLSLCAKIELTVPWLYDAPSVTKQQIGGWFVGGHNTPTIVQSQIQLRRSPGIGHSLLRSLGRNSGFDCISISVLLYSVKILRLTLSYNYQYDNSVIM